MADKEEELKPFVLRFSTEPEVYDVSGQDVKALNFERAKKLNLSDIYKPESANTCPVTTEYWSGEQTDVAVDWIND